VAVRENRWGWVRTLGIIVADSPFSRPCEALLYEKSRLPSQKKLAGFGEAEGLGGKLELTGKLVAETKVAE